MLRPIEQAPAKNVTEATHSVAANTKQPGSPAFAKVFGSELEKQARATLSHHAEQRFDQRSLQLGTSSLERLGSALDLAQEKGVKTTLILLDGLAVVANVQERRIVTALPAAQAKERVFTHIDGVILA